MTERTLEQRYEDYVQGGDLAALGDVFDRVAPELGRLARRLAPDAATAEDLVQETFLTALERPGSYDASRPLRPWLLGILAHRARAARRLAGRSPESDRLPQRVEPEPDAALADAELRASVAEAVEALPPTLRAAVRGRVLEERGTADLAAELGLSPGALRVRLTRGLARLREALPAGLASALALLLGRSVSGVSARDLAGVRERVLAEAARRTPAAAETAGRGVALASSAGGAGASAAAVGALMANKKLVVAVAVAVLSVAGLRTFGGNESRSTEELSAGAPAAAFDTPASDELALSAPVVASAPGVPATTRAAAERAPATGGIEDARLRVTVRHEFGEPLPADLSLVLQRALPLEPHATNVPLDLELDGGVGRAELALPAQSVVASLFAFVSSTTIEELQNVDVQLVSGEVRELELVLRGGATLEGIVVDEQDRPVPGALVEGWCDPWAEGRAQRTTRSDERGRFRLEHLGAEFVARAGTDELVPFRELRGRLKSGDVARGLELRVGYPVELRGRVLAPDGRPAVGARVSTRALPMSEPTAVNAVLLHPTDASQRSGAEARTDAGGEFVLTGLVPERCTLEVEFEGLPVHSEYATAGAEALTVQLASGLELTGRVVDPSGAPVAGARVHYGPYLDGLHNGPRTVETDAAGRFAITGLPDLDSADGTPMVAALRNELGDREWRGASWIGVVHEGYAIARVDPLPPAAAGELVVELEPALAVAGRVLDDSRAPLAGVRVWVERARGDDPTPALLGGYNSIDEAAVALHARTDSGGRFRIEALGAGEWVLHAVPPGFQGEDLSFPATAGDEELELVLDDALLRGVVLRGRVTDSFTGEPVRSFRVTLSSRTAQGESQSYRQVSQELNDARGSFELSAGLPTPLSVFVSSPGYAESRLPEREYELGEHELEIQLAPSRSLTVDVVDPEGERFGRTRLTAQFRNARGEWHQQRSGPVHLHGLPAEAFTLVVDADGTQAEFPVDLRTPYEGTLTLVVEVVAQTELELMVIELTGALDEQQFRTELERAMERRDREWFDVARERGDFAFPSEEVRLEVVDGAGAVLCHGVLTPEASGSYRWTGWDGADESRPMPSHDGPFPMGSPRWPAGEATLRLTAEGYGDAELAVGGATRATGDPVGEALPTLVFLRRR